MLQPDLRRGRIEQKCAPKPPPIRPRKPWQTNGGTDEPDLRRGRIEQKCAPKPPPIRPRKPLQTNGGTDELAIRAQLGLLSLRAREIDSKGCLSPSRPKMCAPPPCGSVRWRSDERRV